MSLNARRPRSEYHARNGFREPSKPLSELDKVLCDVERQRRALYVFQEKGRPVPSLQQMKEAVSTPDDAQTLRQRIKELQDQHVQDMDRLAQIHAYEYQEDAMDRYLSKDETQYLVPGENNPSAREAYERLDILYQESRKQYSQKLNYEDDVARLRHSHLSLILPLQEKLAKMEAQNEASERQRNAQFPVTMYEYRNIPSDIQLRVARFLLADKHQQEIIMSEFGWAYRQVQPLKDAFEKNADFKREIQSKVHPDEYPKRRPWINV